MRQRPSGRIPIMNDSTGLFAGISCLCTESDCTAAYYKPEVANRAVSSIERDPPDNTLVLRRETVQLWRLQSVRQRRRRLWTNRK